MNLDNLEQGNLLKRSSSTLLISPKIKDSSQFDIILSSEKFQYGASFQQFRTRISFS